jgi:hypothetical protein
VTEFRQDFEKGDTVDYEDIPYGTIFVSLWFLMCICALIWALICKHRRKASDADPEGASSPERLVGEWFHSEVDGSDMDQEEDQEDLSCVSDHDASKREGLQ